MSEPAVRYVVASGVATIQFNRPDTLNALDLTAKTDLLAALEAAGADDTVRCVVITGSGRAFCVGQDLKEHASRLTSIGAAEVWATVPEHFNPIALALQQLHKPVIAAVNGVAAGAGASIAFLADLRIVSRSAGFNLAFAAIALSCDTGCSWTLPRLVGPTRALELLLNPRTISAAEALDLGIATEVVADDEFAARVEAVAGRLAQGPTLAYAALRQSVSYAASHSLAESVVFEAEMMKLTGSSTDHRLAVDAFLAKQRPTFTGR
jgi:2-(1,2-epoxy-1,2-dihydrophenyl)acetyl-CoA isomerase